jgi:hypothetical protein
MDGYDPHKAPSKFAQVELDKADDIDYIINYWKAVGQLPIPGVPSIEKLDDWKKGLNLE